MTTELGDSTSKDEEHRGIPKAIFIEDAEEYVRNQGFSTYQEAHRDLEEKYRKYRFMEQSLVAQRLRLKQQIPDISNTLQVVRHLQSCRDRPFDTTFEVSDQLHARARVESSQRVGLWLGANVMLEYDLDDAERVLTTNREAAERILSTVDNDLDFLKDQITTSEVNMARLYNLTLKAKKQLEK